MSFRERSSSPWMGLAAAALLLSAGAGAVELHDAAVLDRGWRSENIQQHLTRIGAADRTAELARHLDEIARGSMATPYRDRLLSLGVQRMQYMDRTDAGRALLRSLTHLEPRSFVSLPDAGRDVPVPVANVGADARWMLARWAGLDRRDATLAALSRGDPSELQALAQNAGSLAQIQAQRGILEAVHTVDPALLAGVRDTLVALVGTSAAATEAASIAAIRLTDRDLAALTISQGQPSALVHRIPELAAAFDATTASALMTDALARPVLAGPAMEQLAALSVEGSTGIQPLLDALGDPVTGGNAAAALASMGDDRIVSRLEALLDGDDLVMRRSLLVLGLMGTPAADAALDRFLQREDVPAELAREVSAWNAR